MGVAVDHAAHAVAGEPGLHGGRRDVGDRLGHPAGLQLTVPGLAGGARLRGEGEPGLQGLREEPRLPRRVAGLCAELLVGDVVGAQQVAMQEQGRPAVQQHHRGIRQQAHPAPPRVACAEQEVAVAAHEGDRHAGIDQGAQPPGHEGAGLGRIVVADPGLEQVAEDVQRIGAARLAIQEAAEQLGDRGARRVEVEVGDEQGGHGVILRMRRIARGWWVAPERRRWMACGGDSNGMFAGAAKECPPAAG